MDMHIMQMQGAKTLYCQIMNIYETDIGLISSLYPCSSQGVDCADYEHFSLPVLLPLISALSA